MSLEDYRKGYEAGYFWGRIDELKGAPYEVIAEPPHIDTEDDEE